MFQTTNQFWNKETNQKQQIHHTCMGHGISQWQVPRRLSKGVCIFGAKKAKKTQQNRFGAKNSSQKELTGPKRWEKQTKKRLLGGFPAVSEFFFGGVPGFVYVPILRGVLAHVSILIHRSFRKIIPSEHCLWATTALWWPAQKTRVSKLGSFAGPQKKYLKIRKQIVKWIGKSRPFQSIRHIAERKITMTTRDATTAGDLDVGDL